MAKNRKSKTSIIGTCPSCNAHTSFQFVGIQEWHPDIARKLNVPPKIALYRCDSCDSTVNEFTLGSNSATAS